MAIDVSLMAALTPAFARYRPNQKQKTIQGAEIKSPERGTESQKKRSLLVSKKRKKRSLLDGPSRSVNLSVPRPTWQRQQHENKKSAVPSDLARVFPSKEAIKAIPLRLCPRSS